MTEPDHPNLQRVLVGLGASADDEAILDVAANLAAAMDAQLAALFVEDSGLLDLAGLPFTRIVSATNRPPPELTVANMEAAFRRQAHASRRSVTVHAEKVRARWSFNTVRGSVEQEIQAASSTGDIVVVQSITRGIRSINSISRARSTASAASGLVIAHPLNRTSSGAVAVLDDGDAAGARSITAGRAIAGARGVPLHVLVIPAGKDRDSATLSRAEQLTLGVNNCVIQLLKGDTVGDIALELEHMAPSFLVGDLSGRSFANDEDAERLIAAANAPALLLGP